MDGETYRIRVEEETRYLIRTAGRRRGGGRPGAEGAHARPHRPHRGHRGPAACSGATALVILEAMKMENEFQASGEGTVKEIRVQTGQAVNPGDVLVVIE